MRLILLSAITFCYILSQCSVFTLSFNCHVDLKELYICELISLTKLMYFIKLF